MLRVPRKRILVPVAALAVAAFAVGSAARAPGAPQAINLCAVAGTTDLPGAPGTPIWGFALRTGADCTGVTATLPGPVLEVNEGDTVTIDVTNALPAGHSLTFEIPGIAFDAGPTDAAVGAAVTRSFTASAPGTYLYESGGDAGRQEAMGLYGSLIVRPATAGRAYDDASTAYDVEAPLVLSEVDPAFNAAPDAFDLTDYKATYWLINGTVYPDTPSIAAAEGDRVLLRYLNAGYDNTSMSLLGAHEQVVARDAHLLDNPVSAVAETIPAGATEDAIVTMPPLSSAPGPGGFPLFNRNLHVTDGSGGSNPPGGMLTFLGP